MLQESKIKHLFWRSGFGLTPLEWEKRKNWTTSKSVEFIFEKARRAQSKPLPITGTRFAMRMKDLSKEEKKKLRKEANTQLRKQRADWVRRMADPNESAFLEKMTLFWHGHFACISKGPIVAATQLQTIRDHALGNFKDLVLAISKDASMIRFLNNQQNKKDAPNENFARELMELFTIGRGNYTENDIKEAARAFTGWSSNLRGEFIFRRRQHDYGSKEFMGERGRFDGEDIIDILLSQKQTAYFIANKVYAYFVNPRPNDQHVQYLANVFYSSGYDISKMMATVFSSPWFYDKQNKGVKIKSPVELLAGLMRNLNVKIEDNLAINFIQKALGQVLFNPPNVAGWEGGKSWIDNSTLLLRLNLANYLFKAADVEFELKEELEIKERNPGIKRIKAEIDFTPLVKMLNNKSYEDITYTLRHFLLTPDIELSPSLLKPFLIKSNRTDFVKTLSMRLLTLPEYQMC